MLRPISPLGMQFPHHSTGQQQHKRVPSIKPLQLGGKIHHAFHRSWLGGQQHVLVKHTPHAVNTKMSFMSGTERWLADNTFRQRQLDLHQPSTSKSLWLPARLEDIEDMRKKSRLREEWPWIREKKSSNPSSISKWKKPLDVVQLLLSANSVLSVGWEK